MSGIKIAIIGGGIGGLTAALALRAAGHDVNVYEKAPEFGEIGAGVSLQPNGLRVLEQIGIFDAVAAVSSRFSDTLYRRADGSVVDREGYTGMGIYRPDLVDILVSALPSELLHTGHEAVDYSETPAGAIVRFANRVEVQADLVVAADGIKSTLQRFISGEVPEPPVFSGHMAYRSVLPAEQAPEFPVGSSQDWLGGDRYVRAYHLRQGKMLNFVAVVPADEGMRESWTLPGDPAQLVAQFDDHWDPMVRKLASLVPDTLRYALYDREPLQRWHTDRLVLLGDSAHAMLPMLGQGANSALEDAMALATLLSGASDSDVAECLDLYQQLRHDRAARFQHGSRVHDGRHDMDNPLLRHVPVILDRPGTYDYDVREAANAVRHDYAARARPHSQPRTREWSRTSSGVR